MSAWWDGLSPALTWVTCGGRQHRLQWASGELRACDHDDIDGERTLAALGGERCTCVDILDAWARHATDVRVLVLASRGPADRLAVPDRWAGALRVSSRQTPRGWTRYAPHTAPPRLGPPAPEEDVSALLGLPGGLADRFVAAVLATWTRRLEQSDDACEAARPQLHAALHGRTVLAVRTWLGRPDLAVDVHMTAPDAAPALATVDADHVRAELPFAWLSTVWARGLTTLMGRFCLDATTHDGRDWTLLTVDPAFASVSRMRLQL